MDSIYADFLADEKSLFDKICDRMSSNGKLDAIGAYGKGIKNLSGKWEVCHLKAYGDFVITGYGTINHKQQKSQYESNRNKFDAVLKKHGFRNGIENFQREPTNNGVARETVAQYFLALAYYQDDISFLQCFCEFLQYCYENDLPVKAIQERAHKSNDAYGDVFKDIIHGIRQHLAAMGCQERIAYDGNNGAISNAANFEDITSFPNTTDSILLSPRIPQVNGEDNWLNAYNPDSIPFAGRDFEKKRLDEFIACDKLFQIWAIIAPSGAGKTRLMAHWANTTPELEGWECRLLNSEDREKPRKWSNWSPEKPTLIIIDYLFGYEKVLKHLIRRCQKKLDNFVRLLIIDHVIATPLESDVRWGLSNRKEKLDIKKSFFFDTEPLWLAQTDDQEGVITQIIASCSQLQSTDLMIKQAKEYLRSTTGAWHPLFAALVGKAIKEKENYSAWSRRDLIDYYLIGKSLPWEGMGKNGRWASYFIAAATARRGIQFYDLGNIPRCTGMKPPKDFDSIINICRKIVANTNEIILPPFEPDLLGESFFLLFLEKSQNSHEMRSAFIEVLISGNRNIQTNGAIEFIGFITRLTVNLSNDDRNSFTLKKWNVLLDFLRPMNIPDGYPIRWAMNCCLSLVALRIKDFFPLKALELLDRIHQPDFYNVNETVFLDHSAYCSMIMIELRAELKKIEPTISNEIFKLWVRNCNEIAEHRKRNKIKYNSEDLYSILQGKAIHLHGYALLHQCEYVASQFEHLNGEIPIWVWSDEIDKWPKKLNNSRDWDYDPNQWRDEDFYRDEDYE